MSEEINFDDIGFGEPIEEREPNYRDGYIRGIYRARNIIDSKQKEIERLNNKYSKALELLIDYNLPCEIDDFMNVHSDYCETNCGVDEEQYKRCWNKFIEWKLGSDKE